MGAFALGKEFRVDELSSFRHMELSWQEFLVCLAAVVRLRRDFDEEFFADMLCDFFQDYVTKALQRQSAKNGNGGTASLLDAPEMQPVVSLVTRVFDDADEDKSGTLSVREL